MRFAAQAKLAEALGGADPMLADELRAVLEAARFMNDRVVELGRAGGAPEVKLEIRGPGGLTIPLGGEVGPSASAVVGRPPRSVASLSFDTINKTARPEPGLFAAMMQQLPGALKEAGLQPGDIVTGSPIGSMHGDYKRALAYMKHGAGPLDVAHQQRARIADDYSLQPLLLYEMDPGFAGRLGWPGGY